MKVMTAMSGGVDSSVAAYLLQQQGAEVCGATLYLTGEPQQDAAQAAAFLHIPFYEFDRRKAFEENVISAFAQSYESGETPNPCIVCNRLIKFGLLLDEALAMGQDYLATGHYARLKHDKASGRTLLLRAKDVRKDQTYMLYRLTQHQLSHAMFPLGEYTKPQIREIAASIGIQTAHKPDSQDICFIPDGDYVSFLEKRRGMPYPEGSYVDETGTVLGRHRGMVRYTIGQRKGLGIALGEPAFVLRKDAAQNLVVLGREEKLFSRRITARDANWIACDQPTDGMRVTAKTRYSQKEAAAVIHLTEQGFVAEFDEPQRAATPGQAMVLYDGETVIGGGTITRE